MCQSNRYPREPGRELGNAYLGLSFALVLLAIAMDGYIEWKEADIRRNGAKRTAEGIVRIQTALHSYRLDPAHGYAWPSSIADLNAYIPGLAAGGRNGVGQPYALTASVPATPTSGIFIETDMLTAHGASDVARLFPLTGSVPAGTTRVRVGVPVPGHEAAREAVLARDGSRSMRGSLDVGGNDIMNLDQVEIQGQVIDGDAARLLLALQNLTCTGDERLAIVGGTPQCLAP